MKDELFYPKDELFPLAKFKNMQDYDKLVNNFKQDYEKTWGNLARENLHWIKPFNTTLDSSKSPFYKWFIDGKINVSNECIDVHLAKKANQNAIIFEADNGDVENISYQKLSEEVNKTANLLKNICNVKKGDRVVLYMPMIPQAIYAMLACTRIGAIHSVVFGGFSAEALRSRISDAQAKVVITADGAYRKGDAYLLKPIVDDALKKECKEVEKVVVVKRNHKDINWVEGRDICYNEQVNLQPIICAYEEMDSEDTMFLLYTSGSTGKPKGVQHSSAGYILWAKLTTSWVFDLQHNDTFWCTADIGWITGHTYSVYGPLANGATTLIFEGVPTYPDAGRCWKIIQDKKITQFYTAPTAIRMLQKVGANEPKKYDLTSLRVLGTVGEPIDANAWQWYYQEVGNSICSIVDTWWQTETGGHVITSLPAATPMKPSSATLPLPGLMVEITDKNGNIKGKNENGLIAIVKPWPSMIRNVWGQNDRLVSTYFADISKDGKPVYFSGDGGIYDDNGYICVTGRVDDVLNVSGHRLGTAEIESAIKKNNMVAEVAIVGSLHPIKGDSIFAYVVLKEEFDMSKDDILKDINSTLSKEIGKIAKCDNMVFTQGLPKTRSGKVMRRLLRLIAKKEEIVQDISTLENPSIVKEIQQSNIYG